MHPAQFTKIGITRRPWRYCGLFAVLVCWYYCFISTSSNNTVWVLLAYALLGGAVLPCMPLNHELAIECTYPLGAALSAGTIGILQEFFMFIFGVLFFWLGKDVGVDSDLYENNTCEIKNLEEDEILIPKDYSLSLIVLSVIVTCLAGPALVLFRCPYKRRNADK